MKKVSLIIRNFPECPDLTPLLESICRQTYYCFEVIILDGNKRPFQEMFPWLAEKLKVRKIKLFINEIQNSSEIDFNQILDSTNGEFLAFPEPGNILEPEFISEMAKFLEDNKEFNAVRSNGSFVDELDINYVISPLIDISKPYENNIFHSLLTRQTAINFSLWMVKKPLFQTPYFSKISFDMVQWDWQFVLPLAHKNSVGYLDKNLIRLVHYSGGKIQRIMTHYVERTKYERCFSEACLNVIDRLEAIDKEKITWKKIRNLVSIKSRIYTDTRFRLQTNFLMYKNEIMTLYESLGGKRKIMEMGRFPGELSGYMTAENLTGIMTDYYAELLMRILTSEIKGSLAGWIISQGFGIFNAFLELKYFCLYGSGAAAEELLPTFLAIGFRPKFIWDKNAREDQKLLGIPVLFPEFNSISEAEKQRLEIIVALGRKQPAVEVKNMLSECGFRNVRHIFEIQGLRSYFIDSVSKLSNLNIEPNK